MTSLRLRTPAKINIHLSVLNRRADNYHEIETLFQAIELYDELIIRKREGHSSLAVTNHRDLDNENNLVMRALRWLENVSGRSLNVELKLTKKIPVAAGLGGGSSDAAATLIGLKEFFQLSEVSDEQMRQGAVSLGADVPFFLTGGVAIGAGIGEKLTPIDFKCDYNVLLVNPGFSVSTAEIFAAFSRVLTDQKKKGTLPGLLRRGVELAELLHNDLQRVAESMYPEIAAIRETLAQSGMTEVLMTGSGPTVFAVGDPESLQRVRGSFRQEFTTVFTKPSAKGVLID